MARINGFEQIKGFYSWSFSNQDKGVKPQHISLYLFLVNQNNRNGWVEWFKLPFDLGMSGSCISSKKTYYACLEDLRSWGLILYEKGVNNWKAPLIKLEVLKDTATIPQSEPQPIPHDVPQHIQALILAATPQPTHNIKLLTNNFKLITNNLKQVLEFLGEDIEESKSDDLDQEKKSKLIEEVVSFFGYSEMKFHKQKSLVMAFVNSLPFHGKLDFFIEEFKSYQQLKILDKCPHRIENFLGDQAEQFKNGKWNDNWTQHLTNYNQKNGQTNQRNSGSRATTRIDKKSGYSDL